MGRTVLEGQTGVPVISVPGHPKLIEGRRKLSADDD